MNRPILKQIWIVSGVLLNFMVHGMTMAYTSCLLPALRAADSPVKLDVNTASWLGSAVGLLTAPMMVVACFLMERFGRRNMYVLSSITDATGWILIYWSKDIPSLMLGRLFGGVSIAFGCSVGAVSIAEYSSPKYRGFFLNAKTLTLSFGFFITHVLAHYFDWRTVALISAAPGVLVFVNNRTWVESPSWLLSKNRFDDFEETFYWLRGRDEEAVKEMESMMRAQKARATSTRRSVSFRQTAARFLGKFKQKSFLKPLTILSFNMVLNEAVGKQFFSAFAFDIMSQVTSDKSNQFLYIVILDSMIWISTLISCVLIKLMGRKTLLLLSGIPASVIIVALSAILYLKSTGLLEMKQTWVVPLFMFLFVMMANLGCSPVPLVIFGEIFPLPHRETGTALGGGLLCLMFFLHLLLIPQMLLYLRLHGTFTFMAISMIVSLLVVHFMMPETKDRTLQEIEDYFEHGKFLDEDKADDEDEQTMLRPTGPSKTSAYP